MVYAEVLTLAVYVVSILMLDTYFGARLLLVAQGKVLTRWQTSSSLGRGVLWARSCCCRSRAARRSLRTDTSRTS